MVDFSLAAQYLAAANAAGRRWIPVSLIELVDPTHVAIVGRGSTAFDFSSFNFFELLLCARLTLCVFLFLPCLLHVPSFSCFVAVPFVEFRWILMANQRRLVRGYHGWSCLPWFWHVLISLCSWKALLAFHSHMSSCLFVLMEMDCFS